MRKSKSIAWKFYLSKSESMAWKFYLSKSTEKKILFPEKYFLNKI